MLLHRLERVSWGWGSEITHRLSRNKHGGEQEAVSIDNIRLQFKMDKTSSIGLSLYVKLLGISVIRAEVRQSRNRPVLYQRLV